jgi:tetratricopeptide (TPR) repeat protein
MGEVYGIMKNCLSAIKFSFRMTGYMVVLFLLLYLPSTSFAFQSIYTIQTGSFVQEGGAQKQFDSIVDQLNDEELIHLRIEKIGKYYSVRLGKFADTHIAEKFLSSVQEKLTTFLLMKAYYKEERIERLYESSVEEVHQSVDEPLPQPLYARIERLVSEKDISKFVEKILAMPIEMQIKEISNLVENGEYREAFEVTKAAMALWPEAPEINGLHGTILYKLDQPAEAIKYLKKAVDRFPGVPDYHNRMGYCLILLSKFDEAVNEFNKAISFNPSHIGALAGLGISYAELGNKAKAMDIYKKLQRLDSDITEIFLQIIEGT